ncbi:MAG: 3'-5' exonuclease [Akkermansiaceae bacterium]
MINQVTFTAIDFESAGTSAGSTDTPVQIGTATWSLFNHDTAVEAAPPSLSDTWMSYIHTNKKITWAAQQVHGITKEQLADAPKLMLLWPEIKNRLSGSIVVAHGHGTEKRFLRAFPAHGFGPWVDTLHLSRAAYPSLTDYSLGSICTTLQIVDEISNLSKTASPESRITWHDALYDSIASIVLLKHIIHTFSLQDSPLSLLTQPNTSAWRKNKATN